MASAPPLIIADADFLSSLADVKPGSAEASAIMSLAQKGRLVTIKQARAQAQSSFQALVNFPFYQAIKTLPEDRKLRAKARALASSMPAVGLTRHQNFCDLCVAAAALSNSAGIATTPQRKSFYTSFAPPLKVKVFEAGTLP